MSIRIPTETLPGNYTNGQILYGAEMNKIVNLLREGVNYNKADIDRLLLGVNTDFVFENVETMNDYLVDATPADGQACFVLADENNSNQVSIYVYSVSLANWTLYGDFSLFDMNARAIQIEADLADRSYSSTWYSGVALTGKTAGISALIAATSTETSLNDYYLNIVTGDVYKCVEMSQDGLSALWDWMLDISGAMYWVADNDATSVIYELVDNEDKTFYNLITGTVEITIPAMYQGFYTGINFRVGPAPSPVVFTNNSGLTLKKIRLYSEMINYTPTANKTITILIYCDGLNVYFYVNEIS